MTGRRRPPIDWRAVHDALRAVGIDPDAIGADDVIWLWEQGKTVEQIVRAFVQHAQGRPA